ncbi:hypothetical protein OG756_40365 [Streptomyces sp. NBC_01310]|uniref:hypothetical protein n=1 Tax=Streptomyces sp. NBC_01310 TaxID=2903820 RepID=UPI0035B57442|nr:hypothetical protein OG756_01030 [Streptomyces sp. NBC_01310]WSJ63679.1 hypothetical protein OG756_40365 [Streptomyces sp. NBC_01310]
MPQRPHAPLHATPFTHASRATATPQQRVSLRTTATDGKEGRIAQTVIRAYGLK